MERPGTGHYIEMRCYKGDWQGRVKPILPGQRFPEPQGPPKPILPVIFVSGWQVQLTGRHASGPGFTAESWYRTIAPPPDSDEGEHGGPPPLWELKTRASVKARFEGLATRLKYAGYDHVRFRQSHPADDIQISVDELYAVVNHTKELYQTDKVILVCHSRGGLIARKYIVDRWKQEHIIDVEKVITYGTPHLGANLAEVGSEIIFNVIVSSIPVFGPVLNAWLTILGMIPDVGADIRNRLKEDVIKILEEFVDRFWDGLRAFMESGDQMRPSSDLIMRLNADYSEPVVPGPGNQPVNLWNAIGHVLIAGSMPTLLKVYGGSWVPGLSHLNPANVAEEVAKALAPDGWTEPTWTDPVGHPYWKWDWKWYPMIDVFGGLSLVAPGSDAVPALHAGDGDMVVEKQSALASGVNGKIRRAEFALHHFNITTNDEQTARYVTPTGTEAEVTPWQLLFTELDLPFGTKSQCPQ